MGGSGGGGGGYFPSDPKELARLIENAKASEARKLLDAEVNEFLGRLLVGFNSRDVDKTQRRLDELIAQLEKGTEVEALRFGGSVAKHTHVDGLSDVDALVILGDPDLARQSPHAVLEQFHEALTRRLDRAAVTSVEKGHMAVTVKYQDGSEIQLLPAFRDRGKVFISNADGTRWKETDPGIFRQKLTDQNARLNQQLVPAIKLVKAVLSTLPPQKQLTGYHVEALAIDATAGYLGATTPKDLVVHILQSASTRVLAPIRDVTGQSPYVDEYLGKEGSAQRRNAGQALSLLAGRLKTADVDRWRRLLES